MDRYSEYRVMWILVFFDLPTETQKDKKAYVHIPADTRSAFPVISVQSPVSIQCCWQS